MLIGRMERLGRTLLCGLVGPLALLHASLQADADDATGASPIAPNIATAGAVSGRSAEPSDRAVPATATASAAERLPNVPAWAADAVFYQIFPERFRNGDL